MMATAGTGASCFRKSRTEARNFSQPFGVALKTRGQFFPDQSLCCTMPAGTLIREASVEIAHRVADRLRSKL
jgi:hypothetical protein